MKNFYQLSVGQGAPALMNALMHHQDLFANDGLLVRRREGDLPPVAADGAVQMPILHKTALAVMTLVEGVQLGGVMVLRVKPKAKSLITNPSSFFSNYLLPLHAKPGVSVMVGDEAVDLRSGDVWLANLKEDATLSNNSDDEAFIMLVEVRVET